MRAPSLQTQAAAEVWQNRMLRKSTAVLMPAREESFRQRIDSTAGGGWR
jgi:hypothetical protein